MDKYEHLRGLLDETLGDIDRAQHEIDKARNRISTYLALSPGAPVVTDSIELESAVVPLGRSAE